MHACGCSNLISLLRPWKSLALLPVLCLVSLCATADKTEREGKTCPLHPDAFAAVKERANRNLPEAQTVLASCYELGRHVAPNGREAMHWLSLAAEQGYAPAEYELGRIYLYGRGIPADYGRGMLWEEKAARQGVAKAQRDMAYIYERGLGVAADNAVAARWNRQAAERGDPDGQLHLAQALETANVLEAEMWYLKAAKQNVAAAQLQLARIYARQGRSSCSQALRWYKKAAESGEAPAMYELGKLFQTTCGPDLDRAFIWFRIGARFGSAESQVEADKLLPRLNSAKKRQADATVERWISNHTRTEKEAEEE